jgi:hypothetical protein
VIVRRVGMERPVSRREPRQRVIEHDLRRERRIQMPRTKRVGGYRMALLAANRPSESPGKKMPSVSADRERGRR